MEITMKDGTNRRDLVRAIAEHLDEEAKFQGPPSFAYIVGAMTVDREGNLTGTDEDLTALKPFLVERGFLDAEVNLLEISEPVPDATVNGLKNLVFMLHGKQKLLNKATGGETIHISDLLVNRLREYTPETLEEFTDLLDDCGAMDELQGFDYRDGKVTISFPQDENQPVIWTTYGTLVDKIVKAAMSATRVTPEENGAESEKYRMRSWLLRLGYSGADFKAQRQLLTRNLTGSSAFPDAAKAKKHTEKYLALRKAAREAKEDENERAD